MHIFGDEVKKAHTMINQHYLKQFDTIFTEESKNPSFWKFEAQIIKESRKSNNQAEIS